MSAPVTVRRALAVSVALLVAIGSAETASAQSRRPQRRTPPAQAQPGQQPGASTPAPAGQPEYEASPYIKRVKPRRWTFTAQYFIGASEWLEGQDGVLVPKHDTWQFDSATLVFPAVPETASSILEVRGPSDKEVPAVSGTVELADRVLADEVEIVAQGVGGGPLPSGTWRAQWQVEPPEQGSHIVRELEFSVSTAQTCYETVFDEAGASQVDWPTGPWPPVAAAAFEPQMFVDFDMQGQGYDMSPVSSLIREWTEGKTEQQMRQEVKPVTLAKFLAGQVVEHMQVNGEGLAYDRTGLWQGFDTGGAAEAAATGRGSELDIACLLLAVYRGAGIPSRLVIGYDKEGEDDQVYLKKTEGAGDIRVWVEFCLYDEANKTVGWVPVDIAEMRSQQSRMPPNYLDPSRPLKYFGNHDELDNVAPIAFHFHPPTTVRSYGSPALWGWFVTPTPPGRAVQRADLSVTTSPSGGKSESRLPARFLD
ncbi:MAG TPA: transglutaminase-like domain-containing protein [Phycisphaerales bacterium]|nr:transglutaminase-like domain-containing protein [Phycisphaerales bacterium]